MLENQLFHANRKFVKVWINAWFVSLVRAACPVFGKLVLGLLLWRIFQLGCRWIAHTPDEGSTLQSSGELLLPGYFSHGRVASLIVDVFCVISRATCWGPKCFLCVK